VSASTTRLDVKTKFKVYRRNEVREYLIWRVAKKTVAWYVLRNGKYEPLPVSREGFLQSEVFPGLWLDAKALVRGDLMRVHQVLQQGLQSREHAQFVARLKAGS
jgi:Uma2 family endonuclease